MIRQDQMVIFQHPIYITNSANITIWFQHIPIFLSFLQLPSQSLRLSNKLVRYYIHSSRWTVTSLTSAKWFLVWLHGLVWLLLQNWIWYLPSLYIGLDSAVVAAIVVPIVLVVAVLVIIAVVGVLVTVLRHGSSAKASSLDEPVTATKLAEPL